MAVQRVIDEDGLPPAGRRRPLRLAVEPSYRPTPQPAGVAAGVPAGVPVTVGGRAG